MHLQEGAGHCCLLTGLSLATDAFQKTSVYGCLSTVFILLGLNNLIEKTLCKKASTYGNLCAAAGAAVLIGENNLIIFFVPCCCTLLSFVGAVPPVPHCHCRQVRSGS